LVQTLSRCRSCGLPTPLVEMVEWLPGGTVAFKRLKAVRLTVIDKDLYDRLYGALSQQGSQENGPGFERQKKATRYIAGKVLKGVKARVIRYSVVMKRALETMERYSLLLGMGRIEVERIKIEAGGSLLLKMPFNRYLLSAGIMGVLEQIEGRAYTHRLSQMGEETFKLIMDVCEDDDYDEGDFEGMDLLSPAAPGEDELERCRQCGAPSALDSCNWDEIYGVIEDTRRDRRLAFIPCYMLAALKKAVGYSEKEVAEIMENASYSSTLEQLKSGEVPAGIEELLDGLPVKGWGQATAYDFEEGTWRVTVINPMDVSIITGWLRALYFFEMNREPRISLTEEGLMAGFVLE
jgi:hypothetical protein